MPPNRSTWSGQVWAALPGWVYRLVVLLWFERFFVDHWLVPYISASHIRKHIHIRKRVHTYTFFRSHTCTCLKCFVRDGQEGQEGGGKACGRKGGGAS